MRIPTALLALSLALGPASARAAPAGAEIEARRAAALRLHEERRFAEAATLLERLADETGRSDLLFDAGQARFAAGHRAHALRLWEAYARAPDRTSDDLAVVARRLADARALLTPIALLVHVPADMSEVTATLRRRYDPADQLRPPLVFAGLRPAGGAATAEVALDPGVWELVVAGGGREARLELHVDRSPRAIELSLQPSAPSPAPPPGPPERRRSLPLMLSLGGLGGVSAISGAVLAGIGASRFGDRTRACAADLADLRCVEVGLLAEVRQTGAGGGLVGAGFGIGVAAITAALPVRRRAWIAELAAGGGLLVLGAAWLAGENVAYARATGDADYLARIEPWMARRTVAAALLGAGVGLAVGATTGLVVRRRMTLRPTLGLSGVGLRFGF